MLLGKIFPILLILFLYAIGTATGEHDDFNSHFDCNRINQTCENGRYCTESGRCDCWRGDDGDYYNYYDDQSDQFAGYDCSVNVTDSDQISSASCPCLNGGSCYIGHDNRTFCACPPDFYGEQCHNNRVSVWCDAEGMSLYFRPIRPFTGKVYLGDDPDDGRCTFPIKSYWYRYNIRVIYDNDSCNLTVSNETSDKSFNRTYTYPLTIQYDPLIQTHLDLLIDVTCHYFENGTWITESRFGAERNDDYKGKTITKAYVPIYMDFDYAWPLYLGSWITMNNQLYSTSLYSRIFVESCTFSDSLGYKRITVIKDGCPSDRDRMMGFSDPSWINFDRRGIQYEFRAFRLGNDPVVKVTCRVRMCKRDEEYNCELPDCDDAKRKKRDAGEEFGMRRKRQTGGDEGSVSSTFTVLDPYDENEKAFQVTADKCMAEPVVKSVGITLVALVGVLLVVSVILALCVCRLTIKRAKRRYKGDNSTRGFSNSGFEFEGGITGDLKAQGT